MSNFNVFILDVQYQVLAVQRVPAGNTTRLLLTFTSSPWNITCELPPVFTHIITDRQIERINDGSLSVHMTYRGRTRSGDPIIQIHLPPPTYSEMVVAGVFDLK